MNTDIDVSGLASIYTISNAENGYLSLIVNVNGLACKKDEPGPSRGLMAGSRWAGLGTVGYPRMLPMGCWKRGVDLRLRLSVTEPESSCGPFKNPASHNTLVVEHRKVQQA